MMRLPNLHERPSFKELYAILESLEVKPTTWSTTGTDEGELEDVNDVNNFLLSIISNGLKWLKVDLSEGEISNDPKEVLWDLASKRMAERCGRTAMPEMTRTWIIPASKTHPELKIEIREPPLTGDNLGLKTWGTAYAISKKLEEFGLMCFPHLGLNLEDSFLTEDGSKQTRPKMRVLELGSGTGLVGIAAAAIWKVDVTLTDLPEIYENLLFNVGQNAGAINEMGGNATCAILDWKQSQESPDLGSQDFEIVIAADPLYDDEHPQLIANMIEKYLRNNSSSRALVAVPLRDEGTKALAQNLTNLLGSYGLLSKYQGEEIFWDDWVSPGDDGVKCWWSIWYWDL